MATDGDPWEDDFAPSDRDDTNPDEVGPVPEVVTEPVKDAVTGRYQTARGFSPVTREREIADAKSWQHRYDMMALKLAMMASGTHVLAAESQIQKLEEWMAVAENDRLIRIMLKD